LVLNDSVMGNSAKSDSTMSDTAIITL